MSAKSFILDSMKALHQRLQEALQDLTPEQLHWQSATGGNPISFTVWHYARTEDNIIQFALQRKPTLWQEGGYAEQFGLDARAQGTGMSAEDAAKVRFPSVEALEPYLAGVFKNTEQYIADLNEADLEKELELRGLGKVTNAQLLGNTLMTHGYSHLGEIWYIKGLQGMKGSPV